jgi:hypothetical protein
MNEKLKSLLAQAHIEADDPKDTNWIAERFGMLVVQECIHALDINDGSEHHSTALMEHFGIEETRKCTYTDCDCGCNIPVAKTPEKMLRFLASRLEFAGVADSVASIYARDIRKLIEENYATEPKDPRELRTE